MTTKYKIFNTLNQVTFYTGTLLAVYALVNSYWMKKDLPPDVCPISTNQTIYYLAIALLTLSFIGSFVTSYLKKRNYK